MNHKYNQYHFETSYILRRKTKPVLKTKGPQPKTTKIVYKRHI